MVRQTLSDLPILRFRSQTGTSYVTNIMFKDSNAHGKATTTGTILSNNENNVHTGTLTFSDPDPVGTWKGSSLQPMAGV